MALSGTTQSNGSFSTVVYENADGPVSSVKLALDFSAAVSNVNYDYSAGPFTSVDPDGYHLSQGAQTGTQPVARVSFTLANPGTVTASVDAGASTIKGTNADKTAVVYYAVGAANADFTYSTPASTGGQGAGSTSGSSSSSANKSTTTANGSKVATNNGTTSGSSAVAGDETKAADTPASKDSKKSDRSKKTDAANTADKKSNKAWLWIVLVAIVLAAAYLVTRKVMQNRTAATDAQTEEVKSDKKASNKK
jgi:hypothetical protein